MSDLPKLAKLESGGRPPGFEAAIFCDPELSPTTLGKHQAADDGARHSVSNTYIPAKIIIHTRLCRELPASPFIARFVWPSLPPMSCVLRLLPPRAP